MRYSTSAGRWVLAATVLGSAMASIDATVVGIAIPSIGRQFHSSFGALQWVVTGYTLTLAALLLPGGKLADTFGRRKVFCIGVVWFTLSSAICAIAPNTSALVVARVLQGVGAALLTPGSLAIIESAFEPSDRGRAIGAWSGLGGVASAAGPLLGGYLITAASWRWIFVINIPLGAIVLLLSVRHVPESRDSTMTGRIDLAGASLAVLALASITYGLIEGPTKGWDGHAVDGALLLGAIATVGFLAVEQRSSNPMVPLGVFRIRQFSVTNAVTFFVYAALGGALFLLPIELQVVDHYTPLESGCALLPITVIMFLLSARSGQLASRIGPRLQMSIGPIVVGGGLALLARSTTDPSYVTGVLPAVAVFGLGLAITVAPLTMTALNALPSEHAGMASALNNDVARTGSLIAVALLPALSGISGVTYLDAAAFSAGFRTAVVLAGSWCAIAGAIAAWGIRNPAPVVAAAPRPMCHHCAIDATPLVTDRA